MTHAIIPVRDELHLTASIVTQLWAQPGWSALWILDNRSGPATVEYLAGVRRADPRVRVRRRPRSSIYNMWDEGFHAARDEGAEVVVILNNDLHLYPGTIEALGDAFVGDPDLWITYPDYDATVPHPWRIRYTTGTYRHGGMSGFCFALRTGPICWSPLVDPQFLWWGGDDDLAFTIEAHGGRQGRLVGLPVDHLGEGTARHHPELAAAKAADLARLDAKWHR